MAGKAAPCVLATAEGAATVGTPVEAVSRIRVSDG